jgi:hypothetical protein
MADLSILARFPVLIANAFGHDLLPLYHFSLRGSDITIWRRLMRLQGRKPPHAAEMNPAPRQWNGSSKPSFPTGSRTCPWSAHLTTIAARRPPSRLVPIPTCREDRVSSPPQHLVCVGFSPARPTFRAAKSERRKENAFPLTFNAESRHGDLGDM